MGFVTVDLGTTNIKVAAFSDHLEQIAGESEKVIYQQHGNRVEFDPENYFAMLVSAISRLAPSLTEETRQIILTGQAESLVVLDAAGRPLRAGISWMDTRSILESEELKQAFPEAMAYQITGQPANTPTWPITKMLWLKRNEPEVFNKAAHYVLLKDYIQYCLTGRLAGEYSIYNFSYYFDIRRKDYWDDILVYCGIRRDQLPELVEPCTVIGPLKEEISRQLGLLGQTVVNTGTLDHFAGMIGTGNVREGIISESTGTVVTLATLVSRPLMSQERIPCHYGPFYDMYVLLPVCESGGVSLEWFKEHFAADLSYQELDRQLASRPAPAELLFLPYLTGTNSPDYNEAAKGVFYGMRLKHDRLDFALAVMEGVANLLRRNLECLTKIGIQAERVITTGGGSKSDIWCRIKADLTGYPFAVPALSEAASLGCALIGAVSAGLIESFDRGIEACVTLKKQYQPDGAERYARQRRLYDALYASLLPVFSLDAELTDRL